MATVDPRATLKFSVTHSAKRAFWRHGRHEYDHLWTVPMRGDCLRVYGARINRAFCGNCGSSLCFYPTIDNVHYSKADNVIGAADGSLDYPDQFSPDFAVFVSRALKWATFPEGIERHA